MIRADVAQGSKGIRAASMMARELGDSMEKPVDGSRYRYTDYVSYNVNEKFE